jgi:hypothetical protein
VTRSPAQRLERYTLLRPQEVLLVSASIDGESDQIAIFKGFSSSLMRSTAFDPDVLMLPEGSVIESIDRLVAPYSPAAPQYIQQGLSWADMQQLLEQLGIDDGSSELR